MAVGTAASLLPIKSITRKSTNEIFEFGAEVGECTLRLGKGLKDIMKAKTSDPFAWLERVQESDLRVGGNEDDVVISTKGSIAVCDVREVEVST